MLKTNINLYSIWVVILFLILSLPLSGTYYYVSSGLLIIIGLGYNGSKIRKQRVFSTKAVIVMICIWIFGILWGIIRGNSISNIVRNFAGTICYLVFLTIPNVSSDNKDKIARMLIVSSIISAIIVSITYNLYIFRGGAIGILKNINYNQYTRSIVSSICNLSFVLEAISVYQIIKNKRITLRIFWALAFGLSYYTLVYSTNMDGYLLGFVSVLWISMLGIIVSNNSKRNLFFAIILLIIISGVFIFFDYLHNQNISRIFSKNQSGNLKRYYQFELIFHRFKILGNGIGSSIEYSFGSRDFDSYSVEISYLNCIDKYGVLSIALFYIYFKSVSIPIKNLLHNNGDSIRNIVAIGLMGYLFVAFGNPVLFAPYNIILHCLSLYLSENTGSYSDNCFAK